MQRDGYQRRKKPSCLCSWDVALTTLTTCHWAHDLEVTTTAVSILREGLMVFLR